MEVSWSVEAYGFLDEEMSRKYSLYPGLLVKMSISSERRFVIASQDFVKNILELADMLRRLFIEVVMEFVDSDLLSRITDVDVREALRILVEKQRMLQDALNKFYRARTASDR